jgi:hypothetical protein
VALLLDDMSQIQNQVLAVAVAQMVGAGEAGGMSIVF